MSTTPKTIDQYNKRAQNAESYSTDAPKPWHDFLEKPAMKALRETLVQWKRVLDLWCGTGEQSVEILESWAANVYGIDISSWMVDLAHRAHPDMNFAVWDVENLDIPAWSIDVCVSSLMMHYIQDRNKALENIHTVLSDDWCFIFSTHHPASWKSWSISDVPKKEKLLWYIKNDSWVDVYWDYFDEEVRSYILPDCIHIDHWTKSIEYMFTALTSAWFEVVTIKEPKPTIESKSLYPSFYERYSKIPLFVVFVCKKR